MTIQYYFNAKSDKICDIFHSHIIEKCVLFLLQSNSNTSEVFTALPDVCEPLTWSSANLSRAAAGSAPGDRTKMSGEVQLLSLYDPGRSNGGGSTYFLPIFSITNSCKSKPVIFDIIYINLCITKAIVLTYIHTEFLVKGLYSAGLIKHWLREVTVFQQ